MTRRLLLLGAAALALCAGWLRPGEAAAQCTSLNPPCVNQGPFVTLDPYAGTYNDAYVSVTVDVTDESGIQPSSFVARLNGVVVQSGGATAGARYAVQLGLTLAPGQNNFEVTVCDVQGLCEGNSGTYWYVVPPPPDSFAVPAVELGPYSEGVRSVSPFDAAASYSTPAYVSMDVPRSVTLVYNGAQAQARAYLQVDAVDRSTVAPTRMSIQVLDAAGATTVAETFYQAAKGTNRLAAHWFAPTLATGAYTYQVIVRTYWDLPGRTVVKQSPARAVRVLLLNERRSRLGHGWNVAGLQRMHFRGDSALVTNGDGTAAYYTRTSPTTFQKPQGEWSELSRVDSLWVRRWPDGTKAVFSANGYLKHVEDRFARRTSFTWTMTADGLYRVPSKIVDPVGKETTFGYHYGNSLATITTPGGRASTVWYNGERISQIVAPDGVLDFQGTYGTFDRLLTRTNRDGATYGYAYDAAGFVSADTFPAVTVEGVGTQRPVVSVSAWETAFLPPAGTGTAAAPAPRVDTLAVRARVINPKGAATRLAFDRFLLPTAVEDPHGDTTRITRNAHGQPTVVELPSGGFTQYQYDGPNVTRISEWKSPDDPSGELITTIDYEPPYDLPRLITSGGTETLNTYGTLGQLLSSSMGGYATTYGYTADWRVSWVQEPGGRRTDMRYDSTGFRNLREVSDLNGLGLGRKVEYTSDAYGRTATITDALATVTRRYDLLNRDTAVVDPSGTTRFTWQGSFLRQVIDPLGKAYTFNHNALGWLTSRVDTNGRTMGFGHDVGGNTARVTDRRGLSVTFTHDSLGRMLTRTADGTTTTYGYGPDQRWISATNAVSTDTVKFDGRGRKVEEKTVLFGVPNGTFTRTSAWHEEGPRERLSYNAPGRVSPRIEYRYNNALQLDGLLAFGSWANLYYNNAGLPDTVEVRAGGPKITFQYSYTHMPTQAFWNVAGLNAKLGYRYAWDHVDRLILRSTPDETQERRYFYDARSQLTGTSDYVQTPGEMICEDPFQVSSCHRETVHTQTDTATYTYDAVGNRTGAGAALQPSSNRYQTFRGYTFEYDLEGNVTRKYNSGYNQTLAWNSLGQLVSATTNGVTVTYGYNGFGQRVKRTTGGSSTYSVYDGDDLLLEISGTGALIREYAHYPGIDQPHSMRDAAGNVYYYSMEHPGHVSGLFNAANTVVNEYRYTPWGEMQAVTENVQQPLRYMARELDPITGLYYVRNRWYDPVAGRFVSEDPIGLDGGINLYAYAANSPTNLLDPWGLDTECEITIMVVTIELAGDDAEGRAYHIRCRSTGSTRPRGPSSGMFGFQVGVPIGGGLMGGASGSSSLTYGPAPSVGTIVYDPKANGGWKNDPFHNVPRDLDAYVLAYGQVIRTGPGGYEVRSLPANYFLNGSDTAFRGQFEVGSRPLNTGQPGHFVTHRFFRP